MLICTQKETNCYETGGQFIELHLQDLTRHKSDSTLNVNQNVT